MKGVAPLDAAVCHAASRRQAEVMPEHVLLAFNPAGECAAGVSWLTGGVAGKHVAGGDTKVLDGINRGTASMPVFSAELERWLTDSWLLASASWGQAQINPAVLLASLLHDEGEHVCAPGVQHALNCERDKALQLLRTSGADQAPSLPERAVSGASGALAKYTRNLSELARTGSLDPVLGREAEIRQMVDILLRRRQNNPILTGEPGVGKLRWLKGWRCVLPPVQCRHG